ncbi:hypothetical protein EXIGLDRAFT_733309 [Exidia glandulosa HHB12029]|uniref:Uncharacterized protein n=1 Tax=Exidia glandulosa HHB12029 TaxID=1314781 RepID=A0A165KIJ9_EXIGL|nr:hypothetical protein EXIGLDRAFT_733309 [Exidia glandulosa HHB12029]
MEALSMVRVHECLALVHLPIQRNRRRTSAPALRAKQAVHSRTPVPTSYVATLPIELLQQIMEESYNWGSSSTWTARGARSRAAWIAAASQVSRTWLDAATPALYNTVVLWTPRTAILLLRSLKERPALVRHLRSIMLPGQIDQELWWPWQHWSTNLPPILLAAYSELLALITPRHLAIANSVLVAAPGAGAQLSRFADTVTKLDITLSHDDVALPDFPNLSVLHVHWHGDADIGSLRLADGASYPKLRQLTLSFLTVLQADVLELFGRLRRTLVSLRCNCVLVLGEDGLRVPVAEWVSPLNDHLERLEVVDCELVGSLTTMRKLKHLTLDTDCFAHLPFLGNLFPTSIETVAFEPLRGLPAIMPVYARSAMRMVTLGSDIAPNLKHVEVAVPVTHASMITYWTPLAFLLQEVAAQRQRTFTLNLDAQFWCNGDSFGWKGTRAAQKSTRRGWRLRTVLSFKQRRTSM